MRVAHDEDEGQVHHAEDELETHDDHRGVDELLDPGPDGEGDVFGAGKGMVREDRAGRGGSAGDDGAGGGGGGVIFSVG